MGTTHAIRTQQKKARFLSLLLCIHAIPLCNTVI